MGSYHPAFFLCWPAGRKKQLCNADLSPILAWAAELKKKTQPKRPSIVSLFGMLWCTFLYYVDSVRSLGAGKDLYVICSYLNWRYLSMYIEDLGWIVSCWLFFTFKWKEHGQLKYSYFHHLHLCQMVLCTDNANLGVVNSGEEAGDTQMDVSGGQSTKTVSSTSSPKPPSFPCNNSR
jgi:hypothetical protein